MIGHPLRAPGRRAFRWRDCCALGCGQTRSTMPDPWVAEAERRHALADERLEAGDRPGARDALRGIVDARVPAGLPADDRRARPAGHLLPAGPDRPRRARSARRPRRRRRAASRSGSAGDLFVANLLVVRGAAHEALGDGPAAAEDYHRALVINDKLLAETLSDHPDASRAPAESAVNRLLAAVLLSASAPAPPRPRITRRPAPRTRSRRRRSPRELRRLDVEMTPATRRWSRPTAPRIGHAPDTSARSRPASVRSRSGSRPDRRARALRRRQDALQECGRKRPGARLPAPRK